MTTRFISMPEQLRANAFAYYDAIVWPANRHDFDKANPIPRQQLEIELARIEKKYPRDVDVRSSW